MCPVSRPRRCDSNERGTNQEKLSRKSLGRLTATEDKNMKVDRDDVGRTEITSGELKLHTYLIVAQFFELCVELTCTTELFSKLALCRFPLSFERKPTNLTNFVLFPYAPTAISTYFVRHNAMRRNPKSTYTMCVAPNRNTSHPLHEQQNGNGAKQFPLK